VVGATITGEMKRIFELYPDGLYRHRRQFKIKGRERERGKIKD
jgi:hypothetical protein